MAYSDITDRALITDRNDIIQRLQEDPELGVTAVESIRERTSDALGLAQKRATSANKNLQTLARNHSDPQATIDEEGQLITQVTRGAAAQEPYAETLRGAFEKDGRTMLDTLTDDGISIEQRRQIASHLYPDTECVLDDIWEGLQSGDCDAVTDAVESIEPDNRPELERVFRGVHGDLREHLSLLFNDGEISTLLGS